MMIGMVGWLSALRLECFKAWLVGFENASDTVNSPLTNLGEREK